jgi:hypothetical protein
MRLDYFGLNAAREFPSTHNVAANFILTHLGSTAGPGRLLRLPSRPLRPQSSQLCASEPNLCRRKAAMRRFGYSLFIRLLCICGDDPSWLFLARDGGSQHSRSRYIHNFLEFPLALSSIHLL